MKGKHKNLIIAATVLVLIGMVVLVAMALTRDFDAEGYVNSVLEMTYRGEVDRAAELMGDVTEEDLKEQYEEGVSSFVKNSILSGVELDEETEGKFIELGKDIFGAMEFEMAHTKKISQKEYRVTVNYRPSDVFVKYHSYMESENQRLNKKVEAGDYKGTEEEIKEQLKKEYIGAAYSLLEKACKDMVYDEAAEMEFVVKADTSNVFHLDESKLQDFMIKIMKLDEIQD